MIDDYLNNFQIFQRICIQMKFFLLFHCRIKYCICGDLKNFFQVQLLQISFRQHKGLHHHVVAKIALQLLICISQIIFFFFRVILFIVYLIIISRLLLTRKCFFILVFVFILGKNPFCFPGFCELFSVKFVFLAVELNEFFEDFRYREIIFFENLLYIWNAFPHVDKIKGDFAYLWL